MNITDNMEISITVGEDVWGPYRDFTIDASELGLAIGNRPHELIYRDQTFKLERNQLTGHRSSVLGIYRNGNDTFIIYN